MRATELPRPTFGQRVPQLDGLRGVAILLVLFAHVLGGVYPHDRPLLPFSSFRLGGGGFVGVQLFFVLSGFLITSILLAEREASGRIVLLNFYKRRARRLVPALLTASLLYAGYVMACLPAADREPAWGSIFQAVTYTSNLGPLLPEIPNSNWLNHTWSLAVEEQFYLGWPLLLAVVLPRSRNLALATALTGALITILGRHVISSLRPAHEIMYYMMRWDALLIGCVLALTFKNARVPRLFAGAAWVVLACYCLFPPAAWRAMDYTVVTAACAVALMSAFNSKWLTNRALVWFGMISYGLYIWHLLLMRLDGPTWATAGGSIFVAYFSYRFVELPMLQRRDRRRSAAEDEGHGLVTPESSPGGGH